MPADRFSIESLLIERKTANYGAMAIKRKHRHSTMPPLCKGRWQKSLIFDGGVADTCRSANFDLSIPQSALRLTAPFTQGSRVVRDRHTARNRSRWRNHSLSTSSGSLRSAPSPQGEGLDANIRKAFPDRGRLFVSVVYACAGRLSTRAKNSSGSGPSLRRK